jgi:ABC-type bacteriocin/lantibiotic exporter with double-glycine peptidase domain
MFEKKENGLEILFVFKRLWHHITQPRRRQLSLLLCLIIFTSFAEVASIGAVLPFLSVLTAPERVFSAPLAQPIVHGLGLTEAQQLLYPITIIFILIALFSGAMRLSLLWAQTRLCYSIGADLSVKIYERTLYQPYHVHVGRNSSEVISGISIKTNAVISNSLLPILFVVSSSLIMLAILAALIAIDPYVAMAVIGGFGALYGGILLVTKKSLARDSLRISQESNQLIKALQEGLGGIRDVLIDGTQASYCKIYNDADMLLRRSQANVSILSGAPRYLIESVGMSLIAIVAFAMARQEAGIERALPILGALAIGAQRLLPVLQQLYSNWSAIRGNKSTLLDVLDLLDQPMPAHQGTSLSSPMRFKESIRLNQISFRYGAGLKWVLHEIDILIPRGSRVGFIGSTGCGKSTLLDLIMGLLHPNNGVIEIDGIPIEEGNNRAWQSHISHVPQAIFLADTTIAKNIAFGIPLEKIDLSRVKDAAQLAQISETIDSWEDQYDTLVGERGIRLSGGQRQRIGIARALYKQADVIVFDEATSALDNETERIVMESIDRIDKDVTVFMVAHRLSTLKKCNLIFELMDGKIKRAGSYEEIMRASKRD